MGLEDRYHNEIEITNFTQNGFNRRRMQKCLYDCLIFVETRIITSLFGPNFNLQVKIVAS